MVPRPRMQIRWDALACDILRSQLDIVPVGEGQYQAGFAVVEGGEVWDQVRCG
jgi:hypothetical protein